MKPNQVGLIATAGIVVVLLFSSFVIVDSGQVGVVHSVLSNQKLSKKVSTSKAIYRQCRAN